MKNEAVPSVQRGLERPSNRFGRAASYMVLLLAGLATAVGAQGLDGAPVQSLASEAPLNLGLGANAAFLDPSDIGPGPRGRWVNIAQFRFTGNTLFASKALAAVLAGDLNRPLDFEELHALADKVAGFYRAHGALALVVVPAQDISSRKVTFVVVEARPGKLPMEARLDIKAPVTRIA